MHTYLLQDWTTLRGTTALTTLSQPESGVLDLSFVQDVVGWLEVKEVTPTTGQLTLSYQTAPTKDESLFVTMGVGVALTGPGVTATVMLKNVSSVPLTCWLRWQLGTNGMGITWDLTFRIYLSCNIVGGNRARSLTK